jgi:Tol biopolymer transport system component
VIKRDGTGLRQISGDLGALDVSGTNNWSPDGAWVYFGAERNDFAESHIYRARVDAGYAEQLTFDATSAAPALSPDGTVVVYASWDHQAPSTDGLWLMDADGGNQRLLLASALNDGWSNDGQFVLAEWRPPGADYELLIVRPDGTDRRTLMTFEGGCSSACVKNLGWGQPRP